MEELKNGKDFERLVAVVQEAYNDSPNTKIYTNYKIKDKYSQGKYREFDIFIVSRFNNLDFKIAIECKDYKRPVSVEKIEAFESKCKTITGINKKVFVSTKGFQSGAIENARQFDIDLFTLDKLNDSDFKPLTEISDVRTLEPAFEILNFSVVVENELLGEIEVFPPLINLNTLVKVNTRGVITLKQYVTKQLNHPDISGELIRSILKKGDEENISIDSKLLTVNRDFSFAPIGKFQSFILSSFKNAVSRIVKLDVNVNVNVKVNEVTQMSDRNLYKNIDGKTQGDLVSYLLGSGDTFNIFFDANSYTAKAIVKGNDGISRTLKSTLINKKIE